MTANTQHYTVLGTLPPGEVGYLWGSRVPRRRPQYRLGEPYTGYTPPTEDNRAWWYVGPVVAVRPILRQCYDSDRDVLDVWQESTVVRPLVEGAGG